MFKNIKSHYLLGLFVISAALITTGCATNKIVENNSITIERIDSNTANIHHAYLAHSKDGLTLRGEVKRRISSRGPIIGHLHVTLLSPQGNIIKETDINYIRRNTQSSIATFSAVLPVTLEPGSKVQITHFDTEIHPSHSETTVWRDSDH